jgi:hypothetical protein
VNASLLWHPNCKRIQKKRYHGEVNDRDQDEDEYASYHGKHSHDGRSSRHLIRRRTTKKRQRITMAPMTTSAYMFNVESVEIASAEMGVIIIGLLVDRLQGPTPDDL